MGPAKAGTEESLHTTAACTCQAHAGSVPCAVAASAVATVASQPTAVANTRQQPAGAPSAAPCSVDSRAVRGTPERKHPPRIPHRWHSTRLECDAEIASQSGSRPTGKQAQHGSRRRRQPRGTVRGARRKASKRAPFKFQKYEAHAVQSGRAVSRNELRNVRRCQPQLYTYLRHHDTSYTFSNVGGQAPAAAERDLARRGRGQRARTRPCVSSACPQCRRRRGAPRILLPSAPGGPT